MAVVSESLARRYWPGENPIGKRLEPKLAGSSWCVVIGIAVDVRHWGADVAVEPTAYFPYTQIPVSMQSLVEANMGIAVRSSLPQSELRHSIRAAVAAVDANVPGVADITSRAPR